MNKSDKEKQSRLRQDDKDLRTNETFNIAEESRIAFREGVRTPLTPLKGHKDDLEQNENDDIGISESTLGLSVSSPKEDDADSNDKKVEAVVKRKRKSPLKPWKKSKTMPKRPLSAYNLYYKAERENILAKLRSEGETASDPVELPEMDMDESEQSKNLGTSSESSKKKGNAKKKSGVGFKGLTKTIAGLWNNLSEELKIPYNEVAATEKKRYKAEMVVWRAKEKEAKLRKNILQTDPINPSDDPLLGAVVASLEQVGKPYQVDHKQKPQKGGFSEAHLARRDLDDSIMMPLHRSPHLQPALARGIGGASYPEDWFETESTTSAEAFLGRDTNLSASIGAVTSIDLASYDPEPDYGIFEYPSQDASRQMRRIQQHRQQQLQQHQHQYQPQSHMASQRLMMFEGNQDRSVGNRSSTKRGASALQGSNEIQREFLLQQEEALFPSRRGQGAYRPSIREEQFQVSTQGRIGSTPPTLRHQQIPFVGDDDDRSPLTPFFGLPLEQQLADPSFERTYMQSVMMRSTQQSTEIESFSERGTPRRRIQRDTGNTASSQYRGNDNFPFQQRNSALRPHRSASLPTIDNLPSARSLEYFSRGAEEHRRYSDAGNFGRPRMGASNVDEYSYLGMNPQPHNVSAPLPHLSTTMSSQMNENWIAAGNPRDEHEGRVLEGALYQQGIDVSGRAHHLARQNTTADGPFDPALHRLSQNLDEESLDFFTSIHKGQPEK